MGGGDVAHSGLSRRRLLASGVGATAAVGLAGPIGAARAQGDPLPPFGWLDVRSPLFGAVGDGSTDDTGAIQAAIDSAVAANGGTVLFPPGNYVVDGGLSVPASVPIRLLGSGMAMFNPSALPTTLRRTSGKNTILTVSGESFSTRGWVEISDMTIHGGARHATGVFLDRCQNAYLHRVRIVSCSGTGLHCRQLFNSSGDNIFIHACGNGTQDPALLMDAHPEHSGGCATVHFANVELEGNGGTDIRLTGEVGNAAPANDIKFTNVKMEAGNTQAPYIDLPYAQLCSFHNLQINMGEARQTTPIQEDRASTGATANQFSNVQVALTAGTPYAARLGQGAWQWSNVNVVGIGGHAAAFRVEAGVPTGQFRVENLLTNMGGAKLVSDARPRPSVASAPTITLPNFEPLVQVTGSASVRDVNVHPVGTLVTLRFTAGATMLDGAGNLKLAGDLTATADDTLTLVSDGMSWVELGRSVN